MAAKRLVVVVPSIRGDLGAWQPLIARLKQDLGAADWLLFDHRARVYKTGSARAIAHRLATAINARWVTAGGYDEIILMGHSIGGLLVRQAYLEGLADLRRDAGRPWAMKVTRLVLFAAMNRGFDADRRVWTRFAAWLTRVLPPLRGWLLHDLLRGSDFISNVRITWIREFDRLGPDAPVVVQLLGDRDGLVTADDSTDVQQFRSGFQVTIPDATHGSLIRLETTDDPETRYALIRDAVLGPVPAAAAEASIHGADEVVFVLHGIRAGNTTWVTDLEQLLTKSRPDLDVVTSGYGYFSAAKFALPPTRKKYLRWFQDSYAERLARNPKARFHFIGHSNGTYLLGRSLAAIPGMRFDRVALVGSVLPATYDWRARQELEQVSAIRNDRSARDVPVGVLCSGLRGLGMRDIGTGGVDGFYAYDDPMKEEVAYYTGGHSAPLTGEYLPALVGFAVDGSVRRPEGLLRSVPTRYALLSRAAPWLARLLAVLAIAGLVWFVLAGPWLPVINGLVAAAVLAAVFIAVDLV